MTGALVVGVGMRTGADAADILDAVRAVAAEVEVACLATVDRRAEEPGLVAAAAELGVPVVAFTPDELAAVAVPNPSVRTAAALGAPSVAEAAALLAATGGRLVVRKRVVGGITVATAMFGGR
ncbi:MULTISPECIES: cobalamin biosynthesis protein [unclassified Nocardia]|uniref:cobalamin biosynthesis protein n=1 Tax=unclassified Nocardia TaxID=2637762 RepID=UPI0024A88ED3|nr:MULTISPECIES: cobalamin biosynthesis protein [unclassified Nocardia]